jgi:hypothetical protein
MSRVNQSEVRRVAASDDARGSTIAASKGALGA